jgi:hypothetical protein
LAEAKAAINAAAPVSACSSGSTKERDDLLAKIDAAKREG